MKSASFRLVPEIPRSASPSIRAVTSRANQWWLPRPPQAGWSVSYVFMAAMTDRCTSVVQGCPGKRQGPRSFADPTPGNRGGTGRADRCCLKVP